MFYRILKVNKNLDFLLRVNQFFLSDCKSKNK